MRNGMKALGVVAATVFAGCAGSSHGYSGAATGVAPSTSVSRPRSSAASVSTIVFTGARLSSRRPSTPIATLMLGSRPTSHASTTVFTGALLSSRRPSAPSPAPTPLPTRHTSDVTSLEFSDDGAFLHSAGCDCWYLTWDTTRRVPIFGSHFGPPGATTDHAHIIHGGAQVTLWSSGALELWDIATRRRLWSEDDMTRVDYSPDGRFFSASHAATMEIFDVATGRLVMPAPAPGLPSRDEAYTCAFSPDGRIIADVCDGAELFDWSGHAIEKDGVPLYTTYGSFSRDGRLFAATSQQNVTVIFDVATGKKLQQLSSGDSALEAVFSRDGKLIATYAWDSSPVHVFDVTTGQELGRFGPFGKRGVHALAFSPDGRTLVAGDSEGALHWCDLATLSTPKNP